MSNDPETDKNHENAAPQQRNGVSDHPIPESRRLPNKPLAEAIFDFRWDLQTIAGQLRRDPGFRFLIGMFYDRIRKTFPLNVDLPQAEVPEEITGHVVRHQFRVGRDAWPVVQIGPGILTFNETKDYRWETFLPQLLDVLKALFESYPTHISPLSPVQVELKYINATPFDSSKSDLLEFLRDCLHTRIEMDPSLFDASVSSPTPIDINLAMRYRLQRPAAIGVMSFAAGKRGDVPSIIWQILVRSHGGHVPKKQEHFEAWLNEAHQVAEKWFLTLSRGKLYESFERVNGDDHI